MNYDKRFKVPWKKQLISICSDFRRRNNPKEWEMFFTRDEFNDSTIAEEIAIEVITCIERFHNFSQEVLQVIEAKFEFSQDYSKYHYYVPLEFMEVYSTQLIVKTEYPPYKDLAPADDEDDETIWDAADDFIDDFRDLYMHGVDDPRDFFPALAELKEYGFTHPYIAFLKSDYYNMIGEYGKSMKAIEPIEDCYYKFLQMGVIYQLSENYKEALEYFGKALELAKGWIDPSIIHGIIISYCELDMMQDALNAAREFVDIGYEHVAMSYLKDLVDGFFEFIQEQGREEITENDAFFAREHYKMEESFEEVLKICQYALNQGFEDSSWQIDKLEALFECGHFEEAEKLALELKEKANSISDEELVKVDEILGKLAFEAGDVKKAYEILDDVKERVNFNRRFYYALGKMYRKTGRVKDAYNVLTKLVFYFESIEFYYELALCYLTEDEGKESAHYYLGQVYEMNPDYENAAYFLVQSAFEGGQIELGAQIYKDVKEHIDPYYRLIVEGQLLEMSEKDRKVEKYYEDVLEKYNQDPNCPKYVLDQLCLRYLINLFERNEMFLTFERRCKAAMSDYYAGPETYSYFATRLVEVDDNKQAYLYFLKALEMDQFQPDALYGIAYCAIEEEMAEEAEKYCELYMAYTENEEAFELYSLYLERLSFGKIDQELEEQMMKLCKKGELEKALGLIVTNIKDDSPAAYYRTACQLAIHCGDGNTALRLAKLYEKKFQGEFFLEDIEMIKTKAYLLKGNLMFAYGIGTNIETVEGQRMAALLNIMAGEYKDARKIYRELLASEVNVEENYIGAAFLEMLVGNDEESMTLAQKGIELFDRQHRFPEDFNNPEICCDYGYLNTLAGHVDKAKEVFDMALSMETCQFGYCHMCDEAHLGLGVLAALMGDKVAFEEEFEKAFAIQPNNPFAKHVYKLLKKKSAKSYLKALISTKR